VTCVTGRSSETMLLNTCDATAATEVSLQLVFLVATGLGLYVGLE
jgi:hypothetical protein